MNAEAATLNNVEQPTLKTENVNDVPKTNTAPQGSALECHICYEESNEPVTTMCGHIFCWSCIYKWITAKSSNNYCPMCKNTVTEDKLIPLYPKNYDQDKTNANFEEGVPKRPKAKREERNKPTHRTWSPFTGININMPNFAVSIGCLPTLLPMLIMILVNVFACIFSDDEEYYSTDNSDMETVNDGIHGIPTNEVYETDAFDWTVIILMIVFISLPFILAKFRGRRH